jgi:hydrogenase maturation protease
MTVEALVREAVGNILVPGPSRSLAGLNLVRDVAVGEGGVKITLAGAALGSAAREWVKEKVTGGVCKLRGIKEVDVVFADTKVSELNQIGNVIAVMSGKGGVGKSLVSSLTAIALRRKGFEVGVLDADITGPSIPHMFGIKARPGGGEGGMLPVTTKTGIEVMSINLLLQSDDDAVIWRGPLIAKAIQQFYEEVLWGKLDYLVVDLPPGTADAPLTVMQSLPVSGVIIVFTPQDLTAMIVRKAVKMARQVGKPVIGVVENMSYLYVPELDKKIELFGKSRGEEMAAAAGAPLLAQIAIDPRLAALCDDGEIERYEGETMDALSEALTRVLPVKAAA